MTEVEQLLSTIEKKGYTHIIFDLDATLTLLNLPWDKWIELVAKRLPAEAADSFRKVANEPGSTWSQRSNDHVERYDNFLEALVEASEEFESTYFAHTPYDELVQGVHALAEQGKTLYAWSANTRPTVEHALLELGIRHHFSKVITRNDVRFAKPHPEGWSLLGGGTPRAQYLFVGDSSNDEGAAEALELDYYEITFFHNTRH